MKIVSTIKTIHLAILTITTVAVAFTLYVASPNNIVIYALSVGADNVSISYPIEQLGGCASEADCKQYCNRNDHAGACLNFALEKGLMSTDEIAVARKFLMGEIKGPGGCSDKESCHSYCDDISRADECIAFVEENNLLPPSELQEFKRVQAAIKRGITPPACKNKQSCEEYCEAPSHMEECVTFGIEAGFLDGKEKENAQKMLAAVKRGVTPPSCRGRQQCETFCSEPENMEQCMNFAIEAGFMPPEEAENAKKMLTAIKNGVKPLSCRGKEECDTYCNSEEHREECMQFAEAAGMMTAEEAALARKTGGKGPGGCMGREECEAFCHSEANREICFTFAKENGLISEHDMRPREGHGGPGGMMPGSNMPVPPCQTQEECEKFKMMQEERMRSEMMNRQNMPVPEGQPMPRSEGGTGEYPQPTDYQKQYEEQYRQQYEQQRQQMEQQMQQPPPPSEPAGEPTRETTGFLQDTLLGSFLYAIFQALLP